MLIPRRYLHPALSIVFLLAAAQAAIGQEASADQAAAMLNQGVAQYQSKDYASAKATLLKVDPMRASLSESQQKALDEYLSKSDIAARKQAAALEAIRSAEEALKANDLKKAETLFAEAAGSEFLPDQTRSDAEAQLALVKEKEKLAAAVAKSEPAPANPPVQVQTAPSAPTPAEEVPAAEKPAEVAAETKPAVTPAAELPVAEATTQPAEVASATTQPSESQPQAVVEPAAPAKEDAVAPVAQASVQPEAQAAPATQPSVEVKVQPENAAPAETMPPIARVEPGEAEEAPSDAAIGRLEQRRQLQKQEAVIDYEKALKRSHEALAAGQLTGGDFESAVESAQVAKNVLESSKSLFTSEEYSERLAKVDDQIRWINTRRDSWEKEQAQKQRQELAAAEAKRVSREQESRRRRIESLMAQTRANMAERKFAQAMDSVQGILKIDPQNSWALEHRDILMQMQSLQEEKSIALDYNEQDQKTINASKDAGIPWWELLRYPRDWKEITLRREGAGAGSIAETESNRVTRQRLKQNIQKLEFDGIEFGSVVQFLREVSGLNIDVRWSVLSAVGIEKTTPTNVHLSDVTLEKALRTVLSDVGGATAQLAYMIDEGVITISTKEDLARNPVTCVYDISDLIVRVPTFVGPRLGLASIGSGTGGGGGSTGTSSTGSSGSSGTTGGEETTLTREQMIESITTLIKDTVDANSWRPTGEVGSISELHGQLVVTQTAENQQQVLSLINQLRETKAMQIAIEARFITVSSGFLNDIGVDLDFFFNIGSSLAGTKTYTDPWAPVTPLGNNQIQIPTKTVSPWGNKPGSNNWTPIAMQQNSAAYTKDLVTTGTGLPGGISVPNDAMNLSGAFLDDIQVDFLLRATQAHQSAHLLTAPRLTLYNGQRAYVTVTDQRTYISKLTQTVTPVSGTNVTGFTTEIDYESSTVTTGVLLDVEATISADRRYVTLTLRPQVSELVNMETVVFDSGGGDTSGQGSGFLEVQLPEVSLQEIQTTVSVPDGGTLLIGGQKLAREKEKEIGVPMLDKVPILNRAFTNRTKVRDDQTLLILVRPKIIIQHEAEQLAEEHGGGINP